MKRKVYWKDLFGSFTHSKGRFLSILTLMLLGSLALVPLKVYLKDGYAKLLLGLAKGKHDYDKRESIKRREQNRDIARVMKQYNTR